MSKRGLSLDEKKTKMLEIFHETKDFYQLKELEKLGPKMKGIVTQSVKDVLTDLLNDGLVQFDKIGTSNYYWCFPSMEGAAKQSKLDSLRTELDALEKKVVEAEGSLQEARSEREETPARSALLARLTAAQRTSEELKSELAAYGAADPVKIEEKRKAIGIAKEAAQRWTDNTMILCSVARKMGASEEEIMGFLEIGSEWEELPL